MRIKHYFVLLSALTICSSVQGEPPDGMPQGLRLEYKVQQLWFREKDCTLTITIRYYLHGKAETECPRYSSGNQKSRLLTDEETTYFLNLANKSDLLKDFRPGKDMRNADGSFNILTVIISGGAAAHVTTRNPSFNEGHRRQLLEAISELYYELNPK